jgi:hypothetical protein
MQQKCLRSGCQKAAPISQSRWNRSSASDAGFDYRTGHTGPRLDRRLRAGAEHAAGGLHSFVSGGEAVSMPCTPLAVEPQGTLRNLDTHNANEIPCKTEPKDIEIDMTRIYRAYLHIICRSTI